MRKTKPHKGHYLLLVGMGLFSSLIFFEGCADGTVATFGKRTSGTASYQQERGDYMVSMLGWAIFSGGGGYGLYKVFQPDSGRTDDR